MNSNILKITRISVLSAGALMALKSDANVQSVHACSGCVSDAPPVCSGLPAGVDGWAACYVGSNGCVNSGDICFSV
jgi:hypothetical protein